MKLKKKYYLPLNATMAEKKLMEAQAVEDLSRVLIRAIKPVGINKHHAVFAFDLAIFDVNIMTEALGTVHTTTVLRAMKRAEDKMLRPKHLHTGDIHK